MQELYGVIGSTNEVEPSTVIASLGDVSTKVMYVVPWYGNKKVSASMEIVYDWMLDNDAMFSLVVSNEGRKPPKVLMDKAKETIESDDVDFDIINILAERDIKGIALLVWDESHPERSIEIATSCIESGIPSLELTNGLTPIIIDEVSEPEKPVSDAELPSVGEMSFDEETLQVMPAASVKRMARDAGHDVKTKEEAIRVLVGNNTHEEDPKESDGEISTIIVLFNNGVELGFKGDPELLNKMFKMVVSHTTH
jgi:hypothetical protein